MGLHILVLAAGRGTRMHSQIPKVLHHVLFRPLIHHILDLAGSLPQESVTVVLGHGSDEVKAACKQYSGVSFIEQKEQLGTGHAVKVAAPLLSKKNGKLLVLSGDAILLRPKTLENLLADHEKSKVAATLLSADVPCPTGYGRVLRDKKTSRVIGIREELECSAKEKLITEINSGIYCFELKGFFELLAKVKNDNEKREYYLTDVIQLLVERKKGVQATKVQDFQEILGINTRKELEEAECIYSRRINDFWMSEGVTLHQPDTIRIDPLSQIGKDSEIEGGVILCDCTLGERVTIESQCRILNSTIGSDVILKQGSYIESSDVGDSTSIGPYAHLRPGSKLGRKVKIGNFVEIKKSSLGDETKASHLSYIGDAQVGKDVNIGCGFITCNYDGGKTKHQTVIEDGVFIGSDSQTVAPVRIGSGSYVASGTTVTEDVPKQSLVLSRGRQVNKVGYVKARIKE